MNDIKHFFTENEKCILNAFATKIEDKNSFLVALAFNKTIITDKLLVDIYNSLYEKINDMSNDDFKCLVEQLPLDTIFV